MLAIGPPGATALKDYLDKELERLGTPLTAPPPTAAYNERIDKLRKALAELRADANLSKEKTQTVGLPALDELTAVWGQREAVVKAHYQKLARPV